MKNTFILYVFDIIRLYFFNNMFGQPFSSLTLTKPRLQDKNRQREYKLAIMLAIDDMTFAYSQQLTLLLNLL
jgi:hypothetical protein